MDDDITYEICDMPFVFKDNRKVSRRKNTTTHPKKFTIAGRIIYPSVISTIKRDIWGAIDTDKRYTVGIEVHGERGKRSGLMVELDATKNTFKNLMDLNSPTSSGHTHLIMKSNTSYVRAVNDYTLSSHELHSHLFDITPTSQGIITISDAPYTEINNLHSRIDGFITSKALSSRNDSEVAFYSDEEELANYCVYSQRVVSYNSDSNTMPLTIEYLGTPCTISVTVLGNDRATVNSIVEFIKANRLDFKTYVEPRKEKTFYTIAASNIGFRLEDLNITSPHLDEIIDQNYNDDFREADTVIHDSIANDKRGLILLHGIPGTGKTSYIKHLITGDSERKIVYIPTHLASAIASPQFISFVKKELTNSVLVIEDAEQVLLSRESMESQKEAVSNILNMTDGILADALNILIICTFNTDTKNLDSALLRKGRLLLNYKFDKLNLSKTNALALKLYGKEVSEPLPLSEIYNLEYDLITPKEPAKTKFGFGT